MTTPQTAQALARNLWLLRNLADGLRLYGAPDKDQMARHMEGVADDIAALTSQATAPIDMVLHCPKCGKQHIDAPGMSSEFDDHTWTNPPHSSHLCHGCGHIWRPSDVRTNGVAAVKTKGKDDSPVGSAEAPAAPAQAPHWFSYGLHCARQVDAANQRCAELQSKLDAALAATPAQPAPVVQPLAAGEQASLFARLCSTEWSSIHPNKVTLEFASEQAAWKFHMDFRAAWDAINDSAAIIASHSMPAPTQDETGAPL